MSLTKKGKMTFIRCALSLILLSLSCECQFDVEPIGWIKTNETMTEGEQLELTFGLLPYQEEWPFFNSIKCIVVVPSLRGIQVSDEVFFLNSTHPKQDLVVTSLSDESSCADKTYIIEIECCDYKQDQGMLDIKSSVIEICVINETPIVLCEDPHFSQRVLGIDEDGKLVKKHICYDTFGKGGEQYELISDKSLKTSAIFEFHRDYYVGKIIITTPLDSVTISTDRIVLGKGIKLYWNSEDTYNIGNEDYGPNLCIEMYGSIAVYSYNEAERFQTIKVNKVTQQTGDAYLNVMIDESTGDLNVFDQHHYGIFQLISNQDYEFYEPVQKERKLTVVKVNGQFVRSHLRSSFGSNETCYAMVLSDIISPRLIKSFSKHLNEL